MILFDLFIDCEISMRHIQGVLMVCLVAAVVVAGFGPDATAQRVAPKVLDDPAQAVTTSPSGDLVPVPGHMTGRLATDLTAPPRAGSLTPPAKIVDRALITDLIMQVDQTLLLDYLTPLVAFGPRVTNTQVCYDSGDWIYDEYKKLGLEVRKHAWAYSGYHGNNIEATIPAANGNDEIYIVCSHYDSVSGSPGADDNGSGTATALAIAKLLTNYQFDVNLRFVAFSGEEQGLLGSHEYVADAVTAGDNIKGVLNADMIAFAVSSSDEKKVKVYHDSQSQWLVNFTDSVAQQYLSLIDLDVIPSGHTWGSDHYYFWQSGFSALFYHEYKFNSYYHSPQDTIANMHIPYWVKCSKLMIATLLELAGQFEPYDLTPDCHVISARDGGVIDFNLDADVANAGRNYIIMASLSGTTPGFMLPGGQAVMPLNWDLVTEFVLGAANTPAFVGFLGTLDANGQATATLNTYGPLPLSLIGQELYFAAACDKPWDYVSDPVDIEIID